MRKIALIAVLFATTAAPAQVQQYTTGRVAPSPKKFDDLKAESVAVRNEITFPEAKEPKWDSRQHGWVGPVKNQGGCGSCWDFSGTAVCEIAFVKAGLGKADEFVLSEQYTLSCYDNGGCNGDDNTTVLKHAKRTGLPFTREYGPYHASEARCNFQQSMQLHRLNDWGFADGDAGYESVGNTQKIKNAIKATGSVGSAIAADSRLMNVRPGEVFRGNARNINHDIVLVGWDDTKIPGRTAWLLRNSWGTSWGEGGYCWIEEGANRVGTEPVFAVVVSPNPPPHDGETVNWRPIVGIALAVLLVIGVVVLVLSRRKVAKG